MSEDCHDSGYAEKVRPCVQKDHAGKLLAEIPPSPDSVINPDIQPFTGKDADAYGMEQEDLLLDRQERELCIKTNLQLRADLGSALRRLSDAIAFVRTEERMQTLCRLQEAIMHLDNDMKNHIP